MHAFMALFFYELVRDQIVFIRLWWSTDCSCVQDHAFSTSLRMEKNASIDQVMSKTDLDHLFMFIYLFIYGFVFWNLFICAV